MSARFVSFRTVKILFLFLWIAYSFLGLLFSRVFLSPMILENSIEIYILGIITPD